MREKLSHQLLNIKFVPVISFVRTYFNKVQNKQKQSGVRLGFEPKPLTRISRVIIRLIERHRNSHIVYDM